MYKVRSTDSRVGHPWSAEEDAKLLEQISNKQDISLIAESHQRTVRGIKLRLVHHAIQLIDKGVFQIETAASYFGISRLDIEDQRAKKTKEHRLTAFKERQPEYHEKYLELLTDIRDTLKILCEHVVTKPTLAMSTTESFTVPSLSPQSKSPRMVKIIRKPSLPAIQAPVQQQHQTYKEDSNDISVNIPLPKLKIDVHSS